MKNLSYLIIITTLSLILSGPKSITAQTLQLEYSTFLGGSSEDRAHGIAVDNKGNVVLTAPIQSSDFPTTPNSLQSSFTGVYVSKINFAGDSLLFSTFLGASGGGANYAHGIAFDKEGCIYVAGNTTRSDFPTTSGAFDRTFHGPADKSHGDVFVVKLDPEGNKIIYATFIGGKGMDICGKIAVDDEGNAYIIGTTSSEDFPATKNAYDQTYNGGNDVGRGDIFVAKVNPSGSNLIYCTYIGGSSTDTYSDNILIDKSGCVYFTGTTSSPDFPATANAFDISYNGGSGIRGAGDGVVVKLNPSGTNIEYSTFIGGNGDEFARSMSLDNNGNVIVVGSSRSADFPVTDNAYKKINGNGGFIVKFDPTLSRLLYSTFWETDIQTSALLNDRLLILTGMTDSKNLYPSQDAFCKINSGGSDICISAFDMKSNKIAYCTYFGGKNTDKVNSIMIKGKFLYLCGNTTSTDFPVTDNAYDRSYNGGTNEYGGDAFCSKFIMDIK